MKKSLKFFTLLVLSFSVFLTACSSQKGTSSKKEEAKKTSNLGYQMDSPKQGEKIAIMSTSKGDIKIRLFPDKAPKTVENFEKLSQKGYYNGVTFHRVIKNFCLQAGDPTATGSGGESIYGSEFEDEFCEDLLNLTGALSMANRGKNTNTSQFFFNHGGPQNFPGIDKFMSSLNKSLISDKYKELYKKYGGNPNLDGYYSKQKKGHTVFGQVFGAESMQVLDNIAESEVDGQDKPKSDVIINSIEIKFYE